MASRTPIHIGLAVGATLFIGLFSASSYSAEISPSGRCELLFEYHHPIVGQLKSLGRTSALKTINRKFAAQVPVEMHEKVIAAADRLADAVEKTGQVSRTVLYPASGFDAGTPFRVFRDAEVVVGIDVHPFTAKRVVPRVADLGTTRVGGEGWVYVGDIDLLGGVAESIIISIERSLSSTSKGPVRIRSVVEIEEALSIRGDGKVHGVVEFDHGDGTRIQRYVHIQSSQLADRTALPRWTAALTENGFDTIFVKAGMSFFSNYSRSFGGYLADSLRQRGGLIVDTDGKLTEWPWETAYQRLIRRIRMTTTDISGLGYGEAIIYGFPSRK